ncbi:MAG: tRNA dihydrouridine synthase [Desulfovibrio sp.]
MTMPKIDKYTPWLAPLAGYSDLPFRLLCRQYGCKVACTEMVSVKGLLYAGKTTRRLLATTEDDLPLVVQLFGSEPELFPEVVEQLVEDGYSSFDLNSGCPVKKVLKSGSGSALHLEPKKLQAIAKNMVKAAGNASVGVKIRLGYYIDDDNFVDIAKSLEDVGVSWITMHPRYAKQMFMGHADWTKLNRLKEAVSIPVIASGDLFTAEDGVRCINETGVDGLMFARGALYDPSIFAQYIKLISGEEAEPPNGHLLAQILRDHIRISREVDDTERSFRKIRSIAPRYAKGLNGVRTLRHHLTQCKKWEELESAATMLEELDVAR